MRSLLVATALLSTWPLAAQVLPDPGTPNPRLQTVQWQNGQIIQLTALPATGLTVIFEQGEEVRDLSIDRSRIEARISSERDGVLLIPRRDGDLGSFEVRTDRRSYRFALRTGNDLMAAYVVRFTSGPAMQELPPTSTGPAFPMMQSAPALPSGTAWTWRIRGDAAVRPASITDDGVRTLIAFPEGAPLPAVFAIGASGDEQVVNGYMRQGVFVIDEIWQELVFRIDAKKATAQRITAKSRAHV